MEAKDSAGTGDGPTRFTAQPLPLGGRYMIVARRNSKLVVSPVFHLSEAQPVREIRLQLAQGMTLQGQVTDDSGQPLAGVKLKLNYDTTYHHSFSGIGNAVSDQEGDFQFEGINPDVPGYYTVTVQDRAGFRPYRQKIKLDPSPISVRLERGAQLRGRVVNAETGEPVEGVEVYAIAVDLDAEPSGYLDAEARTNARGEFLFTRLGKIEYRLDVRGGRVVEQSGGVLARGGQKKAVTIRIEPY